MSDWYMQGLCQGLYLKDQDKDKDSSHKDKDKDQDLNLVLKESLRTRTKDKDNITDHFVVYRDARVSDYCSFVWHEYFIR